MAVIRVNKTKDYTVMSNHHFRDRRLSLKAKGLLSEMLSLPNGWDYTIAGLVTINKENKTAIQSTLKELEESGYLIRTRVQNQKGQFDYIYDIYECPIAEEPQTENLVTDNPCTDSVPLYNTKELNIKNKILNNEINNKEDNNGTICPPQNRKRFIPPMVEEVRAYCKERNNSVDAESFIDYYTARGWKLGKNTMKDWKAAVRTWEKRNFNQSKTDNRKYCKPEEGEDDLSWLY